MGGWECAAPGPGFGLSELFGSCRFLYAMRPTTDPRDKIEETDAPAERGYEAWKRAKVERGLAQARDREAMIPVERILSDLKIER